MSDGDQETLQIADSKVVQGKIDAQPREKAIQASAKEVAFGQLGIRQGSIPEAASDAIDPSFKVKEDITSAFSLLDEAQAAVDHLRVRQGGSLYHKMPP